MGGVLKKIGSVIKSVGNFAKKAVSFASKILNGPLGTIASFIPGIGPFIAGAAKIVGMADGVLNGKGLGGVISGLVSGRPFASKIRRTAASSSAFAARP